MTSINGTSTLNSGENTEVCGGCKGVDIYGGENPNETPVEPPPVDDGAENWTVFLTHRGETTGTPGFMHKYHLGGGAQDGSTSAQDIGLEFGVFNPIGASVGRVITAVNVVCFAAAENSVAPTPTQTARFSFFSHNNTNETPFPVPFLDIPYVSGTVGVSDDLVGKGTNLYFELTGLNYIVPDNKLWGVQFTNLITAGAINAMASYTITIHGTEPKNTVTP